MKSYADKEFYKNNYLMGRSEVIPDSELTYWFMQATSEIRSCTFEQIDTLATIPENVQMCCCEVAEKLYFYDNAKSENGMVLQSYGNDGETATFKTDDFTTEAVKRTVSEIIEKWLLDTGLMYCGVV